MAEETPHPARENLYLDVDDDITAIINKLSKAKKSEVALVVPKRSNVLNSAVNLKLIKKSATKADKKPVLITDDAAISRLAAGLEMHVAPNLKAAAAIPGLNKAGEAQVPSDVIEGETMGEPAKPGKDQQTYQPPTGAAQPAAAAKTADKADKAPGTKGGKIPDFNRFKKKFVLGVLGAVGLVILVLALFFWLPKATIAIEGSTKDQITGFKLTLDTNVKSPEHEQGLLPGIRQSLNKTLTAVFTPSGQKDLGTKAAGTITVRNCDYGSGITLSAGTKFTGSSGKVFVSTGAAQVPGFSGPASSCDVSGANSGKADVAVQAAENGEGYNVASQAYSFSLSSSKVDAVGSQMSGGSSKIATVATQADVDTAKTQLLEKERESGRKELDAKFDEDEYIIKESFNEAVTEITSEPKVDQEGSTGKVTLKVTYSEYGAVKSELEDLIKNRALKQAKDGDNSKQFGVVDSGLSGATFKMLEKSGESAQDFEISTKVLLGPDINFDELKEKVAGKNFSDTVEIVKNYPNVSGADVKFSPFYIRKVPTNPAKVEIKLNTPRP